MLPPKEWIEFQTEAESIDFLKRCGILSQKAKRLKKLVYNGAYTKGIELCKAVGYTSPNVLVIEVCGSLHCINALHLGDMQDGMSDWIKSTKELRTLDAYVVMDFETTGFSPSNDSVIEIAAIKYINGEQFEVFSTLVNPQCHVSSQITKITGLADSDLIDAPCMADVVDDLHDFLGGFPIVAHNASFEMRFLDAIYSEHGYSLCNEFIDTLKLARRKFPKLPNHKLQTLLEHYDIHVDAAHRALPDTEATAELFKICISEATSAEEVFSYG